MKVYAGMDPRMPLSQIPAYARRIEGLGYDGLQISETIHDSLASAVLAVEHTRRLTIRTSVTLAFVRSPTLTAYAAWDLAKLSGGRFQLGLGTQIRQNITDRYAMAWGDPVGRLREYVQALNALFVSFRTGEPPHFLGEHYRITRMQPYFNPGPDDGVNAPAIYLGGVNAGMCRLAGEIAEGFVTHPTNSSPRYMETLCRPALTEGAKRVGREVADLELVCGTAVITGSNTAELAAERERQRRLFAFLYSTPAYRRTLELYGWEDLGPRLQAMIRAGNWAELPELVSDDVLEALIPTAPLDTLAAVLRTRFGRLADAILLTPSPDPSNDAHLRAVIEQLRAE